MKIAVLPSDMGAVGYYRMIWPALAVQAARPDWDVRVYNPEEVMVGMIGGELATRGLDTDDLDLVVVQRLGTQRQAAFVPHMQAKGVAVAIDADDALWCIDRDNGAYAAWNSPRSVWNWRWLDKATAAADLVTVTTQALEKRYAPHGRVERIPNGLPDQAYPDVASTPLPGAPVVVGWTGVQASHPHDLEVVGGALGKVLADDPDVMVKVVGDATWAAGVLGVPADRLIDGGKHPLDEYHAALAGVDVGIVPLPDTLFNRCKSSLKALEYSAVGAYVLASPTPANKELQRHIPTIDLVREGEGAWASALHDAIRVMRHEREKVSPSAVRNARTQAINARAHEWVGAWERAVNRRKALDS